MKRWFNTLRGLFGLLRVLSVICILLGTLLAATIGVQPVLARVMRKGLSLADALILLSMATNVFLWGTAWGAFMGLCSRMMQGQTAFTKENSHTLGIIGGCVAAIGTLIFLRCAPRLVTAPWLYSIIEAVVLPGTFWTVAMLAFVLRKLLKNAMELEEAQRDVI